MPEKNAEINRHKMIKKHDEDKNSIKKSYFF
jgi:hypothetical protein